MIREGRKNSLLIEQFAPTFQFLQSITFFVANGNHIHFVSHYYLLTMCASDRSAVNN